MIETKRLLFRPWREADAEELFRLASDPDVGPRAGWPPHKSVEESLEIINTVFNSDHVWALVLKGTGQLRPAPLPVRTTVRGFLAYMLPGMWSGEGLCFHKEPVQGLFQILRQY